MRWVVGLFSRLRKTDPPPIAPIDPIALREEMARSDPSYAHVREVHHDALQAIAADRAAGGLAIRRERQFWERVGRTGWQSQ